MRPSRSADLETDLAIVTMGGAAAGAWLLRSLIDGDPWAAALSLLLVPATLWSVLRLVLAIRATGSRHHATTATPHQRPPARHHVVEDAVSRPSQPATALRRPA